MEEEMVELNLGALRNWNERWCNSYTQGAHTSKIWPIELNAHKNW